MTRADNLLPATPHSQPDTVGEKATTQQHLLVVGPLPPPMSGTHVTFQILCEEAQQMAGGDRVNIVDSSQKRLKKSTRVATWKNLRQCLRIVRQYRALLDQADVVLVFGSNGFLVSMAPILLWFARRAGKPIYLRAFGGSLDRFMERRDPVTRRLLKWTLTHVDGLSVQTKLLHDRFTPILQDAVGVAPGFRRLPDGDRQTWKLDEDDHLHLVFVGIVREDKGIFVLLDALKQLHQEGSKVQCDIYGPLWPKNEDQFRERLPQTQNANYRGVLEPEDVIETLEHYHALVLPTYYQGEGHPGVIIEAMMAGIAVVTTSFRSVPELVQDGVNGLLVPPHDVDACVDAIRRLDRDRILLKELSERNWESRRNYDVDHVAPLIFRQMGVEFEPHSEPEPQPTSDATRVDESLT